MPKAKVYVYLKEGILDPQGKAVHRILKNMNFDQVGDVRVGKFITLDFENNLPDAEIGSQADEICRKLLANPVIEDYHFDIE
ncbi:MAG TPA: phosphoribosylformylglycinamidine synthase subunit PurS [Bacteroidetes bacterium]|nr:phosphoribosylformylglycinamidine synthase subunit PurS [Bacteroidota bacterium]